MADDDVSMDEWDENDAENDEDEGELSDGDWQLSDYRSLFSDWTFGDIEQAITHDRVNFAFDLHEFRNKVRAITLKLQHPHCFVQRVNSGFAILTPSLSINSWALMQP